MRALLWRAWLPAVLFLAWEAAARAGLLNTLFFPPPSRLITAAVNLSRSGELQGHLTATLSRTLAGFAVGAGIGLMCGFVMGLSTSVRRSIEPMISTLISTPKLSLLPILMLALGIGEKPRLALVAAAAFIIAALHALDAVRSVTPDVVELARNYGARSWSLIRLVFLPAGMPQLFTGLRIALGRALAVAVSVEIVGAPQGLGSMIWTGWQTFATENIYIGVFLAAALGATFHALMRLLERMLVPWRN